MSEPAGIRWRRRAVSIPVMLGGTAVAVFGLPFIAPVAVLADVARARARLPTLRVYLFGLQYLINDSVEIMLAPVLWLAATVGKGLDSPTSMARHQRLQGWSVDLLARRAEQLLGLSIHISEEDSAKLGPGPVIVISRHVSLFDASLPGLLYQRLNYRVKGVIMAELLADPGFDLIYGRTGSVFVPRDDGPSAMAQIDAMAADADGTTALVIFPEGRLFSSKVLDRQLGRLATSDQDRAKRLAGLQHVLPPRPGGLVGLLESVPDADVIVLDHRGLDRFRGLADLTTAAPINQQITITVRRIRRMDLPADRVGLTQWLDQLWLDLDQSLGVD